MRGDQVHGKAVIVREGEAPPRSKVYGAGFMNVGLGCKVKGAEIDVRGSGFRVEVVGMSVQGLMFRYFVFALQGEGLFKIKVKG